MGIDSYIKDPKNHKNAHVVTHDDKDSSHGLVVATHPLKTFDNKVKFFTGNLSKRSFKHNGIIFS